MSLGQFAQGLSRGLPVGIRLAEELDRQGDVRASRQAGDLLSQYQSIDPFATMAAPDAQGIAEPGQEVAQVAARGYNPGSIREFQDQYFKAIGRISDPRMYGVAMENFGTMRMNRINEYVDASIAAYDSGNHREASRLMQGAAAFINPTGASEVTIDPRSGAYIFANYDENNNPAGGSALTRDQIIGVRGRNTDWNAWAQLDQRKQEHRDEMSLRYAQFNQSTRNANARLAIAQDENTRRNEIHRLEVANQELENLQLQIDTYTNLATLPVDIAARQATAANTAITQATSADATLQTHQANVDQTNAESFKATVEADLAADKALRTHESGVERAIAEDEQNTAESRLATNRANEAEFNEFMQAAAAALDNVTMYEPEPSQEDLMDQLDALHAPVDEDEDGDKRIKDPFWYEQGTDGNWYLRSGMAGSATKTLADLIKHNPDILPEEAAMVVEGLYGRSQMTDIYVDPEDRKTYAVTPLGHYEISRPVASAADMFRQTMYQDLFNMQRTDAGRQRVIDRAPGSLTQPREPSVPGTPVLPEQAPAGTAAPRIAADMSANPGGVPTGTTGIDDTAAYMQPTPVTPDVNRVSGNEVAITIARWNAAGRPPGGPEADAVRALVSKMSPEQHREFERLLRDRGPDRPMMVPPRPAVPVNNQSTPGARWQAIRRQ